MHPKAGHHLIKNQEGALRARERPQAREKAFGGRHDTHVAGHWLDDHRGNLVRMRLKQPFDGRKVIEGRHQGVGHSRRRHAG
jgi:hypothetical protein